MASSLSLWILNTMVSWRSIWCNSFAVCLLGSMNFEFMIGSIFLYPWKLFQFLWSLICMISYSLVFLLQYLGFVWPTWSIYLAMGRGDLWWVRPYGSWSQWQKGKRHICIVAIKDNKMGVYFYINRSCLHHVIVLIALLSFPMNLIH